MEPKELVVSFLLLFGQAFASGTAFSGHKVLRVQIPDQNAARQIQAVQETHPCSFWGDILAGHFVDLMVPPQADEILEHLERSQLKYSLMIDDVQALIDLEKNPSPGDDGLPARSRGSHMHNLTFDQYHPVEVFHDYFDYLTEMYPFVSTESIGQSFENRDMRIAKICRGGCGNKPAIWLDAGVHAREWIAPATLMYILMELVENDAAHPHLTEKLDWYILPSGNPDGYAFTRESDKNRLWRKTRSRYDGIRCVGTDPNRNFCYHWAEGGSSSIPCTDSYHGPSACSEVEVQNIARFVRQHGEKIKFYNALHSYYQVVLLPWSYTGQESPPGIDRMRELGRIGTAALESVHGTVFGVETIPDLFGPTSGGSIDYMIAEAGVPYAIGMELRDEGQFGFLLPTDQIVPSGQEVFAFHAAVAEEIIAEFVEDDV